MDRKYNLRLDLQFRCNNSTMKFNQFDNNTSDFFMRITNAGKLVDIEKAIVVLAAIKPSGKVASQFVDVENGLVYADLKNSMKDEIGTYTAQAMLILEDERVVTDPINYEVEEDKIFSLLNDTVEYTEEYSLLTDMLNRLSIIEISEEQRQINEAERILSEENRKIEEVKRVEAELIRQHEEADRTKYDAIRESNENIRKQNESIRLSNETNRIDEEAKRVEEENKRKLAEEERKANYNFMIEDEERRRSEANAHKEAEVLRVQAETNRVNEEAKRRTTEQGRVSAENTRVSNENTREANEVARQSNETKRVEAETQRQNRYNSFITEAEANANNFENYTNTAKVKEEERKANELDRKSQEDRRISNENERISNENTRKANEVIREENEISRQNTFTNKVNEVDEKISELNTTKDNFISSINTKVDNKISEIDKSKSDMTNTVTNKIDEVENRFNALTASQQQSSEVIDARDGETSLKARLDRDIEKAKQVYVNVEGSYISTDSSVGYAKDVEILGNTVQDASNLADIRSVGDTVEGQELYEIPVLSRGKNLLTNKLEDFIDETSYKKITINLEIGKDYIMSTNCPIDNGSANLLIGGVFTNTNGCWNNVPRKVIGNGRTDVYIKKSFVSGTFEDFFNGKYYIQLEEGTVATPYEPYIEDKLTILSPVQLEKIGDVADRIIEKDGVWGVEKNVTTGKNLSELNWGKSSLSNSDYNIFYVNGFSPRTSVICNIFSYSPHIGEVAPKQEGINIIGDGSLRISISANKCPDVASFKEYLLNNNCFIKYIGDRVEYKLPHSQQVKLRTFANKTNISFGCEIEGTIKAQVPKSLGATVNTHTEQISNLNKELDRVKKLEESTVSTVETESDFTTVEATSNGYFEDVKLEGKTLVNLMPNELFSTQTYKDNGWRYKYFTLNQPIKPNTDYTVIVNVINNSANVSSVLFGGKGYTFATNKCTITNLGMCMLKVTSLNNGSDYSKFFIQFNDVYDIGEFSCQVMLLEGDHTQNPPSYFEGLKSVGDGADEIVVSSVNENLFDGKFTDGINTYGTLDINKRVWFVLNSSVGDFSFKANAICSGTSYSKLELYASNSPNATSINGMRVVGVFNITNGVVEFTQNKISEKYIYICVPGTTSNVFTLNNIMINKGTTPKPYTPHQSDKKRLLYYNNETQAWEKPVLREWDSIEKHADGKYYYHQRSGEVVLNGSENWNSAPMGSTDADLYIRLTTVLEGLDYTIHSCICDKLAYCGYGSNSEGWDVGSGQRFAIQILKSKLPTQDVAGFKQWLQANNVTVVYQLAQEKVYECTNIDLITYANETNYIVECGAIVPRTTLKVHNNISNVVSLLQKKVSLLESNITSYMITQNRLMLASRYNADTVSFKVDVATLRNSFEYDNDLYELILNNILVGKDNYNRDYIENLIIFYWMDFVISDEMYLTLFEIIEEQHNPKVIEEAPIE